ncbi:MAG: hypothetical protein E7425_10205 [Ruminococcaceae bacterium]|nr:hypothetical protein [Oscillospiraceae bacterium]
MQEQLLFLLEKTFFDEWGRHGADAEAIADAGTQMTAAFAPGGFTAPPIPEGYAAFLSLCDGYAWNGVRFFGTRALQFGRDPRKPCTVPALYDENARYVYRKVDTPLPDGCLVLGDLGDALFLYSAASGQYAAADAETMAVSESFDRFDELFIRHVGAAYYSKLGIWEKKKYREAFGGRE